MPLLRSLQRRRPPEPTGECAVLLASTGVPFTPADLRRAAALAGSAPVAVLSIARLHGSAFGLPNPGLMPTNKDREQQRDIVAEAVRVLQRGGRQVDGQVVISRSPAKTIARAARRRGVQHVVVAAPVQSRVRRLLEGDPVAGVTRRLRSVATVTTRPS